MFLLFFRCQLLFCLVLFVLHLEHQLPVIVALSCSQVFSFIIGIGRLWRASFQDAYMRVVQVDKIELAQQEISKMKMEIAF